MVISNHKRIGLALELLQMGVAPYIGREIKAAVKRGYISGHLIHDYVEDPRLLKKEINQWELAPLLKLMDDSWNVLFQNTLGFSEHSVLGELREWLLKWDNQTSISNDDTDRVLDSVVRFLNAINATDVAADAGRMKKEFRKYLYEEQMRSEKESKELEELRDTQEPEEAEKYDLVKTGVTENLKSWRDVVTPLPDIIGGRYLETEFAADLWQVHKGEATDEYRDPAEFFRRTYLTDSIRKLMLSSIQRISSMDGAPVVLLESGFGGGKTHSLLTLHHLFSGVNASELSGVEPIMKQADVYSLPIVKRAVLVGNKISPSTPDVKPNGLTVRTLWGELAFQLGGKKAFEKIRDHDKKGTPPSDRKLRDLFTSFGPCLILVDEWVAYARQLNDQKDLPGGKLEAQVAFAKNLVSAAKQSKNCLVVISLPVAVALGSSEKQPDDIEIGGVHGMEALTYLRNEIGNAESSWQPATTEEDLEIVRRRLFEPVAPERGKFIKMTAMAFTELYIQKRLEFPAEAQTSLYKSRMQAAFPIHPEIFDRLYHDWSSLIRFQRTRGVLRLMATVIHCLWKKKDRNPIILPSTIPVNDPQVQSELTRYQHKDWATVIGNDVDGPESVSHNIDSDHDHLGQLNAARRVARTIYIGSSPVAEDLQQGIDELRVMLGCVMPGESPAIFHDAIQHLVTASTHLNQDDAQLWYATRPSVTKMAAERAKALLDESELGESDTDKVSEEIEKRLLTQLGTHPDFAGIDLASGPGEVVPDEPACRLVVLPVDQPFSNDTDNPAVYTANNILENCGETPRKYRNALVFLAADESGITDLHETVRLHLAWDAILQEKEELELYDDQLKQVEDQLRATDKKITAWIHAAYKWVLVPTQSEPDQPVSWKAIGLDRADTLAEAAALTLRDKMLMLSALDASTLRVYLDELSLWDEDYLPLQKLVENIAGLNHLPRVSGPKVLLDAVREGLALSTWEEDSFAYADVYNEESGQFDGLKTGEAVEITEDSTGVLVRSERAAAQLAPPEMEPEAEVEDVAVTDSAEETEPVSEMNAESEPEKSSQADAVSSESKVTLVTENVMAPLDVHKELLRSEQSSLESANETADTTAKSSNGVIINGLSSAKLKGKEAADGKQAANGKETANGSEAANGKETANGSETVNGKKSDNGNGKQFQTFHQRIALDPDQAGYDAGLITELLIHHLSEKAGVEVTVTLEINAKLPDGLEQELARIMMECVKPQKSPKLELVNR